MKIIIILQPSNPEMVHTFNDVCPLLTYDKLKFKNVIVLAPPVKQRDELLRRVRLFDYYFL